MPTDDLSLKRLIVTTMQSLSWGCGIVIYSNSTCLDCFRERIRRFQGVYNDQSTTEKRGIRPSPVNIGCFRPGTNINLVPVVQHSAPQSHLIPFLTPLGILNATI